MDGMGEKARNQLTCTSRNVIEWTGWMQSHESVIAERDWRIKPGIKGECSDVLFGFVYASDICRSTLI